MSDLAAQLKTIAEAAASLRTAGVTGTVRVGDVEFTLADQNEQRQSDTAQAADADESPNSALDDFRTYGLPEGSQLPGFTDPRKAGS